MQLGQHVWGMKVLEGQNEKLGVKHSYMGPQMNPPGTAEQHVSLFLIWVKGAFINSVRPFIGC